jgi:hypothetical protein
MTRFTTKSSEIASVSDGECSALSHHVRYVTNLMNNHSR